MGQDIKKKLIKYCNFLSTPYYITEEIALFLPSFFYVCLFQQSSFCCNYIGYVFVLRTREFVVDVRH